MHVERERAIEGVVSVPRRYSVLLFVVSEFVQKEQKLYVARDSSQFVLRQVNVVTRFVTCRAENDHLPSLSIINLLSDLGSTNSTVRAVLSAKPQKASRKCFEVDVVLKDSFRQ